jgi:hypothetical protein
MDARGNRVAKASSDARSDVDRAACIQFHNSSWHAEVNATGRSSIDPTSNRGVFGCFAV